MYQDIVWWWLEICRSLYTPNWYRISDIRWLTGRGWKYTGGFIPDCYLFNLMAWHCIEIRFPRLALTWLDWNAKFVVMFLLRHVLKIKSNGKTSFFLRLISVMSCLTWAQNEDVKSAYVLRPFVFLPHLLCWVRITCIGRFCCTTCKSCFSIALI